MMKTTDFASGYPILFTARRGIVICEWRALYLCEVFPFLVFQSGVSLLFCFSQEFIYGQFNSFL